LLEEDVTRRVSSQVSEMVWCTKIHWFLLIGQYSYFCKERTSNNKWLLTRHMKLFLVFIYYIANQKAEHTVYKSSM